MANAAIKKELRKKLLAKRRALSDEERREYSQRIWSNVEKTGEYQEAKYIMGFASMPDEIESLLFLKKAIAERKSVHIPRITGDGIMEAARLYSTEELLPAAFGILEPPKINSSKAPDKMDLILVPGVGFTARGDRLGMGGGYYDRFLPLATRAARIAVAFSCQLTEMIPIDVTDQRVDVVITEQGIIKCR